MTYVPILAAAIDIAQAPDGVNEYFWIAVGGISTIFLAYNALVIYLVRTHRVERKEWQVERSVLVTAYEKQLREVVTAFDTRLGARDTYIDKVVKNYDGLVGRMATMMEKNAETAGRLGRALEDTNALSGKLVNAVDLSAAAIRREAP